MAVGARRVTPEILALRSAAVPGSASHPRMPSTRKVMPGFAFAAPGPAGGVGSLASRRSGQRPSRQRYYAPLRLPNVHRKVLRNPACSLLPVHSAFVAHEGSARRSGGPFRRGALVSRSTPTGVTPHCSALSQTGNDEALPSSRTIPVSTWPALRPRWCLPGLANSAVAAAAFRLVETVRVPLWQIRHLPPGYPHGPRLSNNFRGSITHPADLLSPAHDLRLLRPQGFAAGLVASLCPGRTSTSWIAKTNFREGATPAFQGYGFNLTRQRSCSSDFPSCLSVIHC